MRLPPHWRLKHQRLRLIGEECGECGAKLFPPRDVCKECGTYLGHLEFPEQPKQESVASFPGKGIERRG